MEEIKEFIEKPIDPYGIFKEPRKTKLLLIAWNVHPGKDYALILNEMKNLDITWVGVDDPNILCSIRPDLNLQNVPPKEIIYNGPFGSIPLGVRKFSLKSILDIMGYDFDVILHIQDWTLFTDVERSPIPYVYIHSEAFYPEVPLCAWKIIGSTLYIQRYLQEKYGNYKFDYDYLPFALRNDLILRDVHKEKRKIKSSFAGELYHFDHMYNERREIVQYLEKSLDSSQFEAHYLGKYNLKDPKKDRPILAGKGRLAGNEYSNLLLKTQIGLNIPTQDNCNFRDFEIPGLGAMLLTKKTSDLIELGFKDGENCVFYKDKEEAEEIIKNGFDPKIAHEGYVHVIKNHTYFKRIKYLINPILRDYCQVEE